MPWAMERQMGAISAVVAVLDMKFVMTQQRMNTTEGQDHRRGVGAQHADHLVGDKLACAGGLQGGGEGEGTAEEEDGLEVDGLEGFLLGDDAGEHQQDRAETSGDSELDLDLILEDHAEQGDDQDHQGENFFPLGNLAEVPHLVEDGTVIVRGVVIGQELEADGGIEEDTGHEDGETDDRVLEEAEAEAEGFEGTLGNHVARRADQGEVAAHGSREDQRHQQAGALEAGLGGDADDHGDQHGGGAGVGENAAHQADDDHDGDDEAALGLGELGDEAADLVGHAGFKQGTADDEHGDKQNDVAVDISGKGG